MVDDEAFTGKQISLNKFLSNYTSVLLPDYAINNTFKAQANVTFAEYQKALIQDWESNVGLSKNDSTLKTVTGFIDDQICLGGRLKIDLIARGCGLKTNELVKLLKEECDRSVAQQVEFQRVELAKSLLVSGKTLQAAYVKAGFSGPELLKNAFERHAGMGFTDYLEALKVNEEKGYDTLA